MDTSKYWAKSDKVTTLVIHNAALREALDKLYELGYIEKEMYELLKIACEYHDLGKINEMFQARMKNKSFILIWKKKFRIMYYLYFLLIQKESTK